MITFSQVHAEPAWLADLRQKAFDKIDQLDLPIIERVKFRRWNLGDGHFRERSTGDSRLLRLISKVYPNGDQTVLEQLPTDLAEQGVVFTDFHCLRRDSELVEKHFMSAVKYDEINWLYHTAANSSAVLYMLAMLRLTGRLEGIFIGQRKRCSF